VAAGAPTASTATAAPAKESRARCLRIGTEGFPLFGGCTADCQCVFALDNQTARQSVGTPNRLDTTRTSASNRYGYGDRPEPEDITSRTGWLLQVRLEHHADPGARPRTPRVRRGPSGSGSAARWGYPGRGLEEERRVRSRAAGRSAGSGDVRTTVVDGRFSCGTGGC
jgi:hypothetical protein